MDLVDVKTFTNLKLIDIVGRTDPYPSLLGMEWAYVNYGVIDLNN